MTHVSAFSTWIDAARAGRGARAAGDTAQAITIFRDLAVAFPSKEGLAAAADGLRACGLWSDAVAMLEDALARWPTSTALTMSLADTFAEMKHFSRAIACVQAYLSRAPNDAVLWVNLGNLGTAAKDWAEAERAYSQGLTLQPLNLDAALGHGDALYRLGRTDEAIAAYRRAAALKPDDPRTHFKLGSLLAAGPDLGEAKAILRNAIALNPANAAAYVNYAGVLHQLGRLAEAVEAARQAIGLDEGLVAAYSTLGTVLLESGQFQAAAEILRYAAELAPGEVMILIALATAENTLDNPRGAERALQRILAIEPDNLEARHMLSAVNGEPVRSIPPGYSRQLFNWYAGKFDQMLAGSLKYRAPEDVTAILFEAKPDPRAFSAVLDLGCGTGLVAEALAKRYVIERKVGVDVAEKMVEVSRRKGFYNEVIHGDAAEVLGDKPAAFDLIAAVDLFVYVGDLAGLMPLMAQALKPGGVLAYSIEMMADGKYKLQRTGRFTHTVKYVEDLARAQGLKPLASRPVTLRQENGADVPGLIGLLQLA